MLDEATIPELFEELSKRFTACALLSLRDSKDKDMERFDVLTHGSPTLILGLMVRAQKSFTIGLFSMEYDVENPEDF
jgi:hypothetical protein